MTWDRFSSRQIARTLSLSLRGREIQSKSPCSYRASCARRCSMQPQVRGDRPGVWGLQPVAVPPVATLRHTEAACRGSGSVISLGPPLTFTTEPAVLFLWRAAERVPASRFRYRAGPVFAAPPCPVELGAECVVPGPVAVDDVALPWFHNAIAATISTTTKIAPMPHAARRPESVALGGGSVTPRPHSARRGGSADVRGGSVGS